MFDKKMDPHVLVDDIHQALREIQEKFGCDSCFSYSVVPNSVGKTMMNMEIKAAQEISVEIPPKIKGWSIQKIHQKVLPILLDLAST
jgi:hypothetical protein